MFKNPKTTRPNVISLGLLFRWAKRLTRSSAKEEHCRLPSVAGRSAADAVRSNTRRARTKQKVNVPGTVRPLPGVPVGGAKYSSDMEPGAKEPDFAARNSHSSRSGAREIHYRCAACRAERCHERCHHGMSREKAHGETRYDETKRQQIIFGPIHRSTALLHRTIRCLRPVRTFSW